MLSASAATSGPMRSKGASARRDSRPGRRTGMAVQPDSASGWGGPPPAGGEQKRRGGVARGRVGDPRGGERLLAQTERQEFAFLRREALQAGPGGRRLYPRCELFAAQQDFF